MLKLKLFIRRKKQYRRTQLEISLLPRGQNLSIHPVQNDTIESLNLILKKKKKRKSRSEESLPVSAYFSSASSKETQLRYRYLYCRSLKLDEMESQPIDSIEIIFSSHSISPHYLGLNFSLLLHHSESRSTFFLPYPV